MAVADRRGELAGRREVGEGHRTILSTRGLRAPRERPRGPDTMASARYGRPMAPEPTIALRPIGVVRSPLTDRAAAPKQGPEGGPDAWLEFDDNLLPALCSIRAGDRLLLLTWFDRADRDVLEVRPRGNPDNPLTGVFSTRSPDRPNPIGLHPVTVIETDGARVLVSDLEALDGTPIVDVKSASASG